MFQIIKSIREDTSVISKLSPALQAIARGSYLVALRWVFSFCALFAFFAWLSIVFVRKFIACIMATPL